jgi:hypothetical protein
MNIDGDGGRREFGLRGQRRGTESMSRKWSSVVRGWGDRLVLQSLGAARGKDSSENRKEQCI